MQIIVSPPEFSSFTRLVAKEVSRKKSKQISFMNISLSKVKKKKTELALVAERGSGRSIRHKHLLLFFFLSKSQTSVEP